jgi:hypothetical protein
MHQQIDFYLKAGLWKVLKRNLGSDRNLSWHVLSTGNVRHFIAF